MLGVTLFGIFLTPVFFYVIEGAIESGPFSWARSRQIGRILSFILTILTLGVFWWPSIVRHIIRRASKSQSPMPEPKVFAAEASASDDGTNGAAHSLTGHTNGIPESSSDPVKSPVPAPGNGPAANGESHRLVHEEGGH
jgi:hypothetical protein